MLWRVVVGGEGGAEWKGGAWSIDAVIPLLVLLAFGIRIHYQGVGEAIRLHRIPSSAECQPVLPQGGDGTPSAVAAAARTRERGIDDVAQLEDEESPEEIAHLIVCPLVTMDLSSLRTLAYGASHGQPPP